VEIVAEAEIQADMAVTQVETLADTSQELQPVLEKCTKQYVQIVSRKQKFLSSHLVRDLYTAENASRTTDHLRDIRHNIYFNKISKGSRINIHLLSQLFFFTTIHFNY
jgi:hypothetical protein